jgi:uncharacterized surface protein with fasciclin (FAS1) repeats
MRTNRKTATVLAAVATAAVTATTAAPATAGPSTAEQQQQSQRSLAKVLAADGNRFDKKWNDFDIVHRAVTTVLGAKKGSAVGVLADGSVALTAFVPTDQAFRRLAYQLTGKRPGTEKATFAKLAKAVDVDTLEAVLLYHVVPGATITYKQALAADGARLDTAADAPLRVNTYRHTVRLRDLDRDDRNPAVIRGLSNINQGNRQIAHGIDMVLRPADLP